MSTGDSHDPLATDRRNVRTTAIGLGVWLTITLAAVLLLFLFGSTLTSIFV